MFKYGRGMRLSNCLTVQTSCLLHFAIVTLYFAVLPFSFQHWYLLLFPLWTKWKIFGIFCSQVSHRFPGFQEARFPAKLQDTPLDISAVFPHYPSPWWSSKFFSLSSPTALTPCMKLTTKLKGLVIWPESLQNYLVISVCYKHFNNYKCLGSCFSVFSILWTINTVHKSLVW